MIISPFTLFTAMVWSTAFVLLLFSCRKSTKLVSYFGVWPLLLLGAEAVARCFLPIEIPPFTRILNLEGPFAKINRFFFSPIAGSWLTPSRLFLVLWTAGTLILLGRFLYRYRRFIKKVNSYEETEDPVLLSLASRAAKALDIKNYRIVEAGGIRIPMLAGLLSPTILLPRYDYSEQDYMAILDHEFTHWKNRDLWVKLIVELLCDIFWWNPFIYLLKADLAQTLEIKCDLTVTQTMSEAEKDSYLRTIEKTIRSNPTREERRTFPYAVTEFAGSGDKDILQRARVILDHRHKPWLERTALVFVSVAMVALLLYSYSFVVQPYFQAPEEQIIAGNSQEVSPENSYLVQNKDGSHSLYQNGGHLSPVDDEILQFLLQNGFQIKNNGSEKP